MHYIIQWCEASIYAVQNNGTVTYIRGSVLFPYRRRRLRGVESWLSVTLDRLPYSRGS